jgi:hypothetical protein
MPLINYPGDEERKAEPVADPTSLSKRAARRLIQRAFVLAGRDRNVRQHIREARGAILWVIEDWDLAWTIFFDKGKLEFDRRPAKRPDLTLTWPTAEEFFSQIASTARRDDRPERAGNTQLWKFGQPVYAAFLAALREVLLDPVDEDGTRLA